MATRLRNRNSYSYSDSDSDSQSGSGSESDYSYGLSPSDEDKLCAIVDSIAPPQRPSATPESSQPRSQPRSRPPPGPKTRTKTKTRTRTRNRTRSGTAPPASSAAAPPVAPPAIDAALAPSYEDGLGFDIGELEPGADLNLTSPNAAAYSHGPRPRAAADVSRRHGPLEEQPNARLAPLVAPGDTNLAAFVAQTKPRSIPTVLSGAHASYPDLSSALTDQSTSTSETPPPPPPAVADNAGPDSRPPMLRFRTFPHKPFSVSDLTAGVWCELQYYYTLTRLPGGRKTRTAAMRGGTKIHERLERQVFTTVRIDVAKKEDGFGLRLWNIVEGLRSLRDTGLTRELEVWGLVEGNVVNGVIDVLSYENPDPELEEDVLSSRRRSQGSSSSQEQGGTAPSSSSSNKREVFVSDVKTRGSTAPPSQAQVRAATIQLFLYHRFLADMASDKLDYMRIFARYGLDPDEPFSDAFMANIDALHDEVFPSDEDKSASDSAPAVSEISAPAAAAAATTRGHPSVEINMSTLGGASTSSSFTRYGSLRALLTLLKFELHFTFPQGASTLGRVVAVEYRYRAWGERQQQKQQQQQDGSVICVNTFYVEPDILDQYLRDTMQWWRGEREPRGVSLEEAFKCRSCEFVGECDWRMNLDNEALRKARAARAAAVSGSRAFSQKKLATTDW